MKEILLAILLPMSRIKNLTNKFEYDMYFDYKQDIGYVNVSII